MNFLKIAISLISLVVASGTFAGGTAESVAKTDREAPEGRAEIILDQTSYDFDRIRYGETVTAVFPFRNNGDAPLSLYTVPDEASGMKIDISEDSFQPGTSGQIVTAVFPFRNDGDAPLRLYTVPDEQSGMKIDISEDSFEPGTSGQIVATMETKMLFGNVADSISFFTNDRDHREIYLKLTGRVLPIVGAASPIYDVGVVPKEEPFSGKIPLVGFLVEDGDLSGVTLNPSSPQVRSRISSDGTDGGTSPVLEFTLLPELKAGPIQESIEIVSSDPPSVAYLRFFGTKRGDIRVTPDRLLIVRQDVEEESERVMVVESDRPFRITQVEDLTRHLDLTTRTIDSGTKYELVARLKNPEEGQFLGAVRLHTDNTDEPLLEIPVVVGLLSENGENAHQH